MQERLTDTVVRLEHLPGLEQRGLALQLHLGSIIYSGQAGQVRGVVLALEQQHLWARGKYRIYILQWSGWLHGEVGGRADILAIAPGQYHLQRSSWSGRKFDCHFIQDLILASRSPDLKRQVDLVFTK